MQSIVSGEGRHERARGYRSHGSRSAQGGDENPSELPGSQGPPGGVRESGADRADQEIRRMRFGDCWFFFFRNRIVDSMPDHEIKKEEEKEKKKEKRIKKRDDKKKRESERERKKKQHTHAKHTQKRKVNRTIETI